MGPILHLSDHVMQNHQTGEQMTHWNIIKEATKFEYFLCLTCPSASFALQFGDFVRCDCPDARGPLLMNLTKALFLP